MLLILTSLVVSSEKVTSLLKEHEELLRSYTTEHDIDNETQTITQNEAPSQFLELDLHIKPIGSASGTLALLIDGKYKN